MPPAPLRVALLAQVRQNPGLRFGVLDRDSRVRERELTAMAVEGLVEFRDNQPCALLAGPQVFLPDAPMEPGARRLVFLPGVGIRESAP